MTAAAKTGVLAGSLLGVAAVVAAVAAGWALWPSPSGERADPGADPGDARQVALGETLYRQHCASCHGANLEGQPDWRTRNDDGRLPAPPHDASGHTWHHADAQLFGITKDGIAEYAPPGYETDMPAFDGVLSDAEIWAVLSYIKSTWPPEIRDRQSRRDSAARQ